MEKFESVHFFMDKNFTQVKFGSFWAHKLENPNMCDKVFQRVERYYKLDILGSGQPYRKKYRRFQGEGLRGSSLSDQLSFHFASKYKRAYLYLTLLNEIPFCLYILDGAIYAVKHRFAEHLYTRETMFEGYLVGDRYIIDDLVIYNGVTFTGNQFTVINSIFSTDFSMDPVLDPYKITLNTPTDWMHLPDYYNEVTRLWNIPSHTEMQYTTGPYDRTFNVFKVEPHHIKVKRVEKLVVNAETFNDGQERSFTTYYDGRPDIYKIFSGDELFGHLGVGDKFISKKLRKIFSDNRPHLIKCRYSDKFKRWMALA
jgi:hypothetical protein